MFERFDDQFHDSATGFTPNWPSDTSDDFRSWQFGSDKGAVSNGGHQGPLNFDGAAGAFGSAQHDGAGGNIYQRPQSQHEHGDDDGNGDATDDAGQLETQLANAYRKGVEDGQKFALDHRNNAQQDSEKLAIALQSLTSQPGDKLSQILLDQIYLLLERCCISAEPQSKLLQRYCDQLVMLVSRDMANSCLQLHPEDAELLDNLAKDDQPAIRIIADPDLKRGSVRLSHDEGWIETGSQSVLSELQAMRDELGGG